MLAERVHDPDASYRWLGDEPAPQAIATDVPAGADGIAPTEVWTADLQAVVAFAATALPTRPRESVDVRIEPVDPERLAELPDDRFADGNAYAIEVEDGGRPVEALAAAARLTLQVPHEATEVLYSTTGAGWVALEVDSLDPGHVEADVAAPGFYLAVTDHPLAGDDGPPAARVAGLAAAPIAVLAGLVLARRRLVRRRS
jgi:hypothetical protein